MVMIYAREVAVLAILRRIVQEVSSAQDLSQALNIMVNRVAQAIETEACSVYLLDKKHKQYTLGAAIGFPYGCEVSLRLNEGLVGFVGQRAEPLNLSDATAHPNYHYVPETEEERFKAFLGVPIIHQRRVVGVLVVQQQADRKFDEAEEAFLVTVSAQLAGVIAHVQETGQILVVNQSNLEPEPTCVGVGGASGVAVGQAVISYTLIDLNNIPDRLITDIPKEQKCFVKAVAATKLEIKKIWQRLQETLPPEECSLFDAYLQILDSPTLVEEVLAYIAEGQWAPAALRIVVQKRIAVFEAMDDLYLQERASDVEDLGRRLMIHLLSPQRQQIEYPDNTILIGEEISASILAEVPEDKLKAIVSGKGSVNSHVAILARAMGIPAVMGISGLVSAISESEVLIVDGYSGNIFVAPSQKLQEKYQKLAEDQKALHKSLTKLKKLPAQTLDGTRVHMWVNTGLVADIRPSLQVGAEGVGLYRTEVPFMIRDRFPSEDEQYLLYRQLLESFAPRPVIVRTLDVGGDKPLPYFNIMEDNPSLGWRGLRITLDHPEIFLVQLRALFRATHGLNNAKVMLPMVSNMNEVNDSLRLIYQAFEEVRQDGLDIQFPEVGAMIEVPAAVHLIPYMAKNLDFFSVGSNDLTQYMLAVDRNNTHVASLYDYLHPSILQTLKYVVDSAHTYRKRVSLCGEMAGDPAAAILLLAMGYDALSMSATSLPRIKWVIRSFTLQQAQRVLEEVMTMEDPKQIRHRLNKALEEAGLFGLVRPGK